jgi:hypothetical protein
MREFEKMMSALMNQMEDIAGELYDNDEVREYFEQYYGFRPEMDDALQMIMEHIERRYM